MTTEKKEKKEKVTLVTLPQELLDKTFCLTLPNTFVGRAHEYNHDRNYAVGSIIEPHPSWREAIKLRSTHSKVLKAIDEVLSKLTELEIEVIDHGDCPPFWGSEEPHPFSTCMSSAAWEAIVHKNDITTVSITNRFIPMHTSIHTGGDYTRGHFTATKANNTWKFQTASWMTPDEVDRRTSWVHWERMAEANKLTREGAIHVLLRTWTKKGLTVVTLADMIRAMMLPTEQLERQSWTVAAAKEKFYEGFHDGSPMLVSVGRWARDRREDARAAAGL